MTTRIYYTDPACTEFDAVVTRALEHDGRPAAALERTAFYPTSGGQPYDTGRLGDADVVDVLEDGDGVVVHVLSAALPEGTRVAGRVDWQRRFDHMQQHTGQHVLSAAFDRLFGNRTMSFHMGTTVSTIDLAREMASGEIDRAVAEANRVVFENRPVSIRFVSEEEAARLPLRKEPVRAGALRLIEVQDFDLSACGGTHVARTGAIGLIAVLGAERFRGGLRVSFVCGGRALAAFDAHRKALAGVVKQLSVLPDELPAAVGRLHGEARDLRKTIGRLQEALAGHEAERLLAGATAIRDTRAVHAVLEGWDAGGLKSIASAAITRPGVSVAFVSAPAPSAVVIARSPGVGVDANRILRELAAMFHGRGGGKPELAQGGGFDAPPEEILAAARKLLESALTSDS
ncbi:MAG TPA: DHHA1 domain-containing protein [Vicinamibacterales bacterium]|nr:DHHA1 domain-containing protein [Vicinamibacterales bacterium]